MFYEKYLNNEKPPTHLLMTGGKLYVQDNNDFLREYHKAILDGEKFSIVEKIDKQLKFKMFMDIDIKEPLQDKVGFIRSLLNDCDKLRAGGCMAIVCEGHNTHGLHIIFQRWNVDATEANAFVSKLDYDIDTSVFKTGLRMPFSQKGRVDQYYYPKYLWKNGVLTALENQDFIYDFQLFEGCCIRTNYNTKYKPLDNIQNSCKISNSLENFVRSIAPEYNNINILSVSKMKDSISCLSDSKYCLNIKKNHGKNHVYFVIRNKKLYQKCHCDKYNCKSFRSKLFNVPWVVLEELNQKI